MQRVEGAASIAIQAPCLDLAEGQNPPVERDDVELAPARAVVALDDLKAAPDEVLSGELLAQLTELSPGVFGHRADATPRPVTRGPHPATSLRNATRCACAEL